jgi:L-fuconolactonase
MQIDSHHHLWKYDPQQYPWITEENRALARDYLPADLEPLIARASIDGTIVVQARQTLEETRWLLELAKSHPFIRAVVGWVPLIDPDIEDVLAELAGETKLQAVRHVLQDEPDDAYMLRDDFDRGISRLAAVNLVYDILIYGRHLKNTTTFVDRHPTQPFVLDHIAKPTIASARFDQEWATQIRELALRDNLVCKFSGVATEVRDPEWTTELIRPYFDTVLQAFGPERLMFGSDWPVCVLRSGYGQWVSTVRELIGELSPTEQSHIMGLTACRVYRLEMP